MVTRHLKKRECPNCKNELRFTHRHRVWFIALPVIFLFDKFVAKPYLNSNEYTALSFFSYSIMLYVLMHFTMIVKPSNKT